MKKRFYFLLFVFLFFVRISLVQAEGAYVKSILIDRNPLTEFESTNVGPYEIKVDSTKDKIVIGYDYDTSIYQGSGSFGEISLNYGENNLTFTVTNKEDVSDSTTYTMKVIRPDIRSTDNNLTSLTVGNNKVVLGDTNEYNVTVDGKVSSVEIHATLPDKASFVDGYGERIGNNSVKLSGETTSVEVKVKAENGNIKTYKINIIRANMQSSDATLKSLKLDGIDFDFKSNKYEYDLSVKHNIVSTKIEAVKNNEKATVDYQENVILKTGSNIIEIKVTAEDSSTKTYKLNINREEEIPIVKDIKITGIDFKFAPKTYNYRIETSLSKLDFNITLSNETATSEILNNENLKDGSTIKIEAKDGDDTVTYTFRIVNKVSSVDNTKTTNVNKSNNDILKNNEMIISLVIFGLGILSTLVAVLVKRKSKIM